MPAHFLVQPDADDTATDLQVGSVLTVRGQTAHHISRVLRARLGQSLPCFDGQGLKFTATVHAISKQSVELEVLDVAQREERSQGSQTHLALSLLKGQAMDRALQNAVELGADQISLVPAARSNVVLAADRLHKKLEHWQRIIVSACEQSSQVHLPSLTVSDSWAALLSARENQTVLALHMEGRTLTPQDVSGDVMALIGPEGGWGAAELELFAQHDIALINIAKATVRAETAPGIVLALLDFSREIS